jgi:hypothetical protein
MENPNLTWVRGLSWTSSQWNLDNRRTKNALNTLQWRMRSDQKQFIGFRLARPAIITGEET